MNRGIDEQMDRQMDRQMNGWIDIHNIYMYFALNHINESY